MWVWGKEFEALRKWSIKTAGGKCSSRNNHIHSSNYRVFMYKKFQLHVSHNLVGLLVRPGLVVLRYRVQNSVRHQKCFSMFTVKQVGLDKKLLVIMVHLFHTFTHFQTHLHKYNCTLNVKQQVAFIETVEKKINCYELYRLNL